MGFGRLSSVWPVWGSPVVYNGKVYFVAGFVPRWTLFAYCLDAATGNLIWCNDGRMLESGWNSSLGPLSFSTDHTKIYGTTEGKNFAWAISPVTGELVGHTGHNPGKDEVGPWWYIDGSGNNASSETLSILVGAQTFTQAGVQALGVKGTVASILAGDGKLFVSTTNGSIYCFGGSNVTPTIYTSGTTPLPATTDVWTSAVQTMLSRDDLKQGLALVLGVGSGRLVEELVKQAPGLMVVAVDPDPAKLRALRLEMDAAGLSGTQVSTLQGNPMDFSFTPNQAALITSEDVNVAGYASGQAMAQAFYIAARPFGGEIWLPTLSAQNSAITGWLGAANLPTCNSSASYSVSMQTGFAGLGVDGFTRIQRLGLPDAMQAIVPPFRLGAFGVSGEERVHNGQDPTQYALDPRPPFSMQNYWITWGAGSNVVKGVKPGCNVAGTVVAGAGRDIYNWLPVSASEIGYEPAVAANYNTSISTSVPSLLANTMLNSLYSRFEQAPSIYPSTSCSQVDGYGNMALTPGKVANLMDRLNYWGVSVLPEAGGCGGAAFAANGVVVFAPTSECACNRSMARTQLGLVPTTDQNEENWVNYQLGSSPRQVQESRVQHAAINFGAPGDRIEPGRQLLWTHHPSFGYKGEAAPMIPVTYRGSVTGRYHYSGQMPVNNAARGWVSASSVTGLTGLTVPVSTPLVAAQTATPPTIDGSLAESCWSGQPRVNIPLSVAYTPVNQYGPNDTCYVMLRYDANNLYIGGCMNAVAAPLYKYMQVSLNSREMLAPTVLLQCGDFGQASQGIPTSAWQTAYQKAAGPGNVFTAEMAIPWSALAAAGLWKGQLVMNVEICGSMLDGGEFWWLGSFAGGFTPGYLCPFNLSKCFSPIYLDAARGPVTETQPHTVRLYFTEMDGMTAGQRVFDVALQGQTVLSSFDAAAVAGPKTEVIKEFSNIQITDHLDIDLTARAGAPMLSGVEVINTGTSAANVPPVAAISASVVSGTAPLAVTLNAQNSYDPDGQIVECVWDTGDGRLSRGSVLNHVYAEPGTYNVSLLVLDNRGATATTGTTVTVGVGAPSAFVCTIRSIGNNGDYTGLAAWNTAVSSDLTSSAMVFSVSNKLTYAATDNGLPVTFSGSGTGILQWINSVNSTAIITNCSGIINTGTVTISSGHAFIIANSGTSAGQSLLFQTTGGVGTYTTADDGTAVTFAGGGTGTLRHINTGGIAYVTGCLGTIQAGSVSCVSGHTFNVADSGHPICTAVAECYNDWPSGLSESPVLSGSGGWMTDINHCVTIRAATGQAHSGVLKNGANYTGFGLASAKSLTTTAAPYTRIQQIIDNAGTITVGIGSSVNRVLGSVTASGSSVLVANSVGPAFRAMPSNAPNYRVGFYNCTGSTFTLASSLRYQVRTVNCLAYVSSTTGFTSGAALGVYYDPAPEFWLSHCVSAGNTATGCDGWKEGNEGNANNQTISFANAASGDYHLQSSDAGAQGRGQPGLGADIAGNTRLGPTFDVGAFQTSNAGKTCLLSGSVAKPGTVNLQWTCNPSNGETGYRIDVSTNGGASFSTLATGLSPNSSSLVTSNIPIVSGTQIYRVTAYNANGDTLQSQTLALAPLNAVQAWSAGYGLPPDGTGNGALTACPAHDGIPNLTKYALGLNPNVSGYSGQYTTGTANVGGTNYLSFTYTRPEPAPAGVVYIPETSPDLSAGSWSNTTPALVSSTISVSGSQCAVTVRDPDPLGSTTHRFIRLRLTAP